MITAGMFYIYADKMDQHFVSRWCCNIPQEGASRTNWLEFAERAREDFLLELGPNSKPFGNHNVSETLETLNDVKRDWRLEILTILTILKMLKLMITECWAGGIISRRPHTAIAHENERIRYPINELREPLAYLPGPPSA